MLSVALIISIKNIKHQFITAYSYLFVKVVLVF